MMPPTVSVAMAVYNNARYLRQAIESILNQTFDDFELLIIDDGSTDNSLQVLQEYAARDKRIRLTSRENQGIPKTRNQLLAQAQGEWIAVMDADDIALPERLARQVEFLRAHPQVVCVGTAQEWIDADGQPLKHWQPATQNQEIQAFLLSGKNHICHPSALIRRTAMLQVGGYNETMSTSSDLDLCLKLGEVGELANLTETLLQYRVHMSSISERRVRQQTDNCRAACERAWQRRGIEGQFEANDSWRHEFILQCGWRMFNAGQRQQAIAYGLRAVKAIPLNLEGWRLLACAMVKRLPEGQP